MPANTVGKCFKVTMEFVDGGTTLETRGLPPASASWAVPDILSQRVVSIIRGDGNEYNTFCLLKLLSCIKSSKDLAGTNTALDAAMAS